MHSYDAAISLCEQGGQCQHVLALLTRMCVQFVWPDTSLEYLCDGKKKVSLRFARKQISLNKGNLGITRRKIVEILNSGNNHFEFLLQFDEKLPLVSIINARSYTYIIKLEVL